MNLARLLYPVEVLGPGKRIGLWLCGCTRACPHCANPDLWRPQPQYEISTAQTMQLVRHIADSHPVDGFTITGGEPFEQAGELAELLRGLQTISRDILVYSGYYLAELQSLPDPAVTMVLAHTAALVDGPYIDEQNGNETLKGSANQTLHVLMPEFAQLYETYRRNAKPAIQNFAGSSGIFAVGIHNRGFRAKVEEKLTDYMD